MTASSAVVIAEVVRARRRRGPQRCHQDRYGPSHPSLPYIPNPTYDSRWPAERAACFSPVDHQPIPRRLKSESWNDPLQHNPDNPYQRNLSHRVYPTIGSFLAPF